MWKKKRIRGGIEWRYYDSYGDYTGTRIVMSRYHSFSYMRWNILGYKKKTPYPHYIEYTRRKKEAFVTVQALKGLLIIPTESQSNKYEGRGISILENGKT